MNLLKQFAGRTQRKDASRHNQHREHIRREAAIGGQLFGPAAPGTRREFVCVNKRTWLWHEEWTDTSGIIHNRTTLYDIRPGGIYKMQQNTAYTPVTPQEAKHLHAAAQLYHQHVSTVLYGK